MPQLPPSAVFGSSRPGQAVHVLLLIENSLTMMDHWQDLQQHILPGVLGAVRIANPGINVQIYWETTGKTQDQRATNKTQRHFNDFPDIDIVGLPRNKLSPLFIRQSIDLFLSSDNQKMPITRHLFIVAMSDPIDDLPVSPDTPPHSPPESSDQKWGKLASKLQQNKVFLHIIANPLVRLTRIFEVFRKTMRYQSRQEVIPWQPVDSSHCICHLSGSAKFPEKHDQFTEEWPIVHLPSADPASPSGNSPIEMSDEEMTTPLSPIDMINANAGSGLSLVSRMQALHGLASRRRPGSEPRRRTAVSRASFFRESDPVPSPRRERLMNTKNHHNGNGKERERERVKQLSSVTVSIPQTMAASGSGGSSSALDLRGLTQIQDPGFQARSPISSSSYASGYPAGANSPPKMGMAPASYPPPSPGSDASGASSSTSTLSSSLSLPNVSRTVDQTLEGDSSHSQSPYLNRSQRSGPGLYPLKVGHSHPNMSMLPAMIGPLTGPASPTHTSAADIALPLSPTLFQSPTGSFGPLPFSASSNANTYSTAFPAFAVPYPPFSSGSANSPAYLHRDTPISPTHTQQAHFSSVTEIDPEADADDEIVQASAPPDARGQVPFVFDPMYEAQSVLRLRHAIDSMHDSDSYSLSHPHDREEIQVQSYSKAQAPNTVSSASALGNGSWKGHGQDSMNASSSYIPEASPTRFTPPIEVDTKNVNLDLISLLLVGLKLFDFFIKPILTMIK